MFAKLLKYDLKAIFKYWWIAAASSALLSVIGGFCINIINVDYTEYTAIYTLAIIGLILCIIGLIIPPILTEILILVRFYKHFFTDEGYLTFTLPVKKSQLLNSKILMSFIFMFLTSLVLMLSILIMLIIGLPEEFLNAKFWADVSETVKNIISYIGAGYTAVYIIEFILFMIAGTLMSSLALFTCLTVASVITKKHKIITAIAIYYGANSVISFITQFVMIDGSFIKVFDKIDSLGVNAQKICIAMIILLVTGVIFAVAAGIHLLESWLLERKLNLE